MSGIIRWNHCEGGCYARSTYFIVRTLSPDSWPAPPRHFAFSLFLGADNSAGTSRLDAPTPITLLASSAWPYFQGKQFTIAEYVTARGNSAYSCPVDMASLSTVSRLIARWKCGRGSVHDDLGRLFDAAQTQANSRDDIFRDMSLPGYIIHHSRFRSGPDDK